MFSERKLRLSAERLRELLHYAPETGLFYWRVSRGSAGAGVQAGKSHSAGYVVIRIDRVNYYAHRLAWLHVHGEHPTGEIDHKNRNPADNSIANLRPSSHPENMRNVARYGSSGFKGVTRHSSKWRAVINVNGRKINLGVHSTPQEAAAAYDKAAREYHGEFATTNEMLGLLPRSPDCTIAAEPAPQTQVRVAIGQSGAAPISGPGSAAQRGFTPERNRNSNGRAALRPGHTPNLTLAAYKYWSRRRWRGGTDHHSWRPNPL
jgi:HNH endonuclease